MGPAEHPRTLAGWPVRHSRGGRGARECGPIPVGISRRISCAQPHLTCAAHRGDSRAGKFGSRSRTTWAGCGWWRESPTGICSPPSHPAETWSWSMEAQRQHNPGLQRADGDAQETPHGGVSTEPVHPVATGEPATPFPTPLVSISHIVVAATKKGESLLRRVASVSRHPLSADGFTPGRLPRLAPAIRSSMGQEPSCCGPWPTAIGCARGSGGRGGMHAHRSLRWRRA